MIVEKQEVEVLEADELPGEPVHDTRDWRECGQVAERTDLRIFGFQRIDHTPMDEHYDTEGFDFLVEVMHS